MKEELLRLFELKDHTEAEQGWKRWFDAAINSPVPAPAEFGRQKLKRLDGPVAHASFSVNTGKLEGFNNKIKAAKRNACGFRNLSFFLLYQIPFNSQNLFLNPQKNMKNQRNRADFLLKTAQNLPEFCVPDVRILPTC